jgi:hypothetical protein
MPPVRFEPTISAGERPQTYALNRAATAGTGRLKDYSFKISLTTTCPKIQYLKIAIYIFITENLSPKMTQLNILAFTWIADSHGERTFITKGNY